METIEDMWIVVLLLIVRVVDVARAEAEERAARVGVLPVVVGVRDVQLARVLRPVAVAVSDERGLPVVVEVDADVV
jgi:hypothetical protein